ncbi:NAD-binding 3-hydroxyacyl-CoA dehydrogenase [Nitzschia inconspicua]|uniref:NAD-binding 3-hydroxyacyl-CoA dehydrogenase n=1 Tax=Nitzschia inconspicua TaxID=303405 RepID=A0A9K3PL60_9STRA|nr:NAD-binding 3-hydroxyacyl-CoA dehydrogenase [Nitzschia inconspicua]
MTARPSLEENQIQLERFGDNNDKNSNSNNTIFVMTMTGTPHKANVFSIPLIQRLDRLLDEVEDNLPCTLVLQGNGQFFSAGFDLNALTGTSHRPPKNKKNSTNQQQQQQTSTQPQPPPQGERLVEQSWKVLARLLVFPAPTIALMNGHAFGLGLFLALACDHRVMLEPREQKLGKSNSSPTRLLCLPEITIGLPLGSGFAALAQCKMRNDTLRSAALTGKQFNTVEALHAGLIDAIIPAESDNNKHNNDNDNYSILPKRIVEMAEHLVPTSTKGNLSAIKMELYGETYQKLVTGKSRSKL